MRYVRARSKYGNQFHRIIKLHSNLQLLWSIKDIDSHIIAIIPIQK